MARFPAPAASGIMRPTCDVGDTATMADQPNNPFADSGGEFKPQVQPYSHSPVAARVPEKVVRGVYCTGQVVLDSPKEFVVDFLQGLTRPFQVAARVVMTPAT